jgi:prolyl oligopeptidase
MDEFRWLEDGNDPAVKAWTHAQNRRTRDYLDAIADREGVLAQLTSLFA